jgi:hypothetical protein
MEQVIDVECYQIDADSIVHDNIDQVLHNNALFRLDAFSYTAGDCLFDAFQVLLHFRYSSTELRNGLIDHFLACLENGNVEALESYQYELASDFLCQLHGIHDVSTYLSKMRLSASATLPPHERGLWGDTFCIRWLAKWLNISIGIWSLTRKRRYLLFNKTASRDPYCILFHDANPLSGHYEPLLYKKLSICNLGGSDIYLSLTCKDLQSHWKRIMHHIHSHGLHIATTITSTCGDSLFNAIFYLIATEFDVHSLCLYTVQSFCNAIIGGSQQAFNCLHQHLLPYLIESMPTIGSWQQYLVNMAMPYEKGNIEGGTFCLQWISIIFRVNIQVWSTLSDGTVHFYCIDSNYDQTIDIISSKTDTPHIHYQPLIRNTSSSRFIVHANQTASNLHKRRILSNHDETHPNCHQVIESLNKKRRLTYHNLKKVIRERNKYIGALPSRPLNCTTDHHEVKGSSTKKHKLTYHNLKKVVCAQHECIYTLPTEHKHHMSNDKDHHPLHHQHGEEAMLVTNVDSTFNMACQQVKLVSSGNHKLTYHMLKK